MEDYAYSGDEHGRKSSQYFVAPPQCEPELCHLPDWHLYGYRERFSSSSFADSESEGEMSKRRASRDVMGPPQTPPKVRRGGGYRGGKRGQPMRGSGFRGPRFSHSSSDDEVFMEPPPVGPRGLHPFPRPPPPFLDDMGDFPPPPFPGDFGDFPPPPPDPFFEHYELHRGRFSEDLPPPPIEMLPRDRRHSMPAAGRDMTRGRGLSRGRSSHRGHNWEDRRSQGHLQPDDSREACSESSIHTVRSSGDEFEYLYRYGFRDPPSSAQEGRQNSWGKPAAAGQRGRPGVVRGRGQAVSRGGFVAGRGAAVKPANKSPTSVRGRGRGANFQPPSRGQKVMKHRPLPPAKPGNAQYMQQFNKGIHSLANVALLKPTLDLSKMSLAEKLHRFMLFVRDDTSARVNDIQTIENAITGCHLDLKSSYEAEDVGLYQGRHTFSGKLTLSGVFLARAVGQVKKELKHECYKLALQVLKTKEVKDILQQHDIGIQAIREKFEECSAPETETDVTDAVVNLASAAPIAVAMETVATPEERWQDFISSLKQMGPVSGNAVSRIEMALSGSRCGLERVYSEVPIIEPSNGKPGFMGSLVLNGILQAQGQGNKKKEAKQRTYEVAIERFVSSDVSQILKGVEPRTIEEVKRESKALHLKVKEIRTEEHIRKFEQFIDRIKDSSVLEGPVTLLDLTANQMQLLITCMYKKTQDVEYHSLCQLYIGDILISEGEGRVKKEAQADAYGKAYEMLISTPVETILGESHRLNKEELQGPDVQDVVVKGQMKKEESNLPRLRNQFANLDEVLSERGSEGMVVVEHQDWVHDRKRHAFCILQNSALMNIMALKWCTDVETGFFTCRLSLQGEELGLAKAHSRQQARNLAAADVLFKMYQTQPVLRIITTDLSDNWVTKVELLEKMKSMPESDFAEADADWNDYLNRKIVTKAELESSDSFELTAEEKEEGKIERRLRVVALKMAEEFRDKGDVLSELTFAPDLPHSVRRFLPSTVHKMGLRSNQSQKDGKIYVSLYFRLRVDKVVEAMKERGVTKTSRFLLVEDRSELPCHDDIVEEIEAAQAMTRHERIMSRINPKGGTNGRESRDAAVGNSLNGSLFEDTEEGFVTAQSSILAEVNQSLQPPRVQSTPNSTPKAASQTTPKTASETSTETTPKTTSKTGTETTPKTTSDTTPQTTPARQATPMRVKMTPPEEVYTKFAWAMMASGVAQTLVPVESSTPVASNILLNPPHSDSDNANSRAAPVIKNILMSPPRAGAISVTLSSPVKNLSSSSSFPQPDFSTAVTPAKCARMSSASDGSHTSSGVSTLSPNTSGSSSGQWQSSRQSAPSQQQSKQSSNRQTLQSAPKHTNQSSARPVQSVTAANRNLNTAQNRFPNYRPYPGANNNPSAYNSDSRANNNPPGANSGGYYDNQYQMAGGGFWQQPTMNSADPSAPHAIQMSPATGNSYAGYDYEAGGGGYSTGNQAAAMYVENEMPSGPGYGRRWNNYNPV